MTGLELPLRAARLVIEPLTAGDAAALAAYRNDLETARYQSWPLPFGPEAAAAVVASGQLALRADGELVGDAMVAPVADREHEDAIGITMAPAWRRRGLAAEAVTALIDAIFRSGKTRASAWVDVRNEPSLRLFDRLGFRREALVHQSFKGRDGLIDEVGFGITADRWRQPTDGLVADVDPHPADIARLDDEIYRFNADRVGVDDGAVVALFERDELGRIVAGATGVVWAGAAELRQLWVDEDRRGGGLGGRLLGAFEDAVRARGAAKIFLATHSFQAPDFYPRFGYRVTGRWDGFPAGHAQVFLEKAF